MDVAARLVEGVAFMLACILAPHDEEVRRNWKWWLGRLCALERLLDEFKHEFSPKASFLLENCEQVPVAPEKAERQLEGVRQFAESAKHSLHLRCVCTCWQALG